MWNGFWKLTLMVSVIGVGLFAVYQAQKGMNRVADSIPADNSADDQSGQKAALEERALPFDPQDEEPKSVSVAQKDHERLPRKSPRTPKNPAEQRIDLVSNITTDLPPLKTALATGKLPTQVATGKRAPRQTGLSFREDEEQSEETTNARTGEPQQLPDDDFLQEVATDFPNRPPRQVSENVIDNVGADLESAVDPFADDAAPATGSTKRENVEPGRARLTTNVGDETDFPRSKRAINGAGRKAETPAEVETNSFDSDLKSNQSQQPSVSDFPAADGLPALGTPEPVVGSTESGPFDTGDILPATPPGRLPSAPLILPSDEPPPTRSLRSKTRSLMPGDLESEPLETPPLRSREPQKRSVDQDRVMPVDMVGDGVAGDASQRGIQQPRVTIEKVAQQQAVLEQPLVYTIIVKNTGTVDALNVVIEDRIPKGTELLGTSPRAELVGKRLIWNELVLKPNEEKKISIKVVPKQEGPIGSVARVYFATEVSAEIVVAAPQLEFTVKTPREVRIGQSFDLVFNLKNVGKVKPIISPFEILFRIT